MARRAQGRGAIAAIGLLVLFAGLVGGVVLWFLASTEPNRAAEGFARAAPGCTTTLSFSETGEFYVYEELFGVIDDVEGCDPTVTPSRGFTFELRDPNGAPVEAVVDTSISYDLDVGQATSVARVSIETPGDYELSVLGNDPAVVAAVGGDPEASVDRLRQGAIAAAIVGTALGGLLLWASGRRSREAATFTSPVDPGWGVTERDRARRAALAAGDEAAATADGVEWPPRPPDLRQVPINPHAPDERRVAQLDTTVDPWAPPSADAVAQAAPVLPSSPSSPPASSPPMAPPPPPPASTVDIADDDVGGGAGNGADDDVVAVSGEAGDDDGRYGRDDDVTS